MIILGAGLIGFGLLTAAPASAQPVPPPTLECNEIGECNIVQYTIENYLRLPGETVGNYLAVPGYTLESYANLVPDTIQNYTGIDIRPPAPTTPAPTESNPE
jgi:hypothetical protein